MIDDAGCGALCGFGVSHIRTNPCPNAYDFTLQAYGTGDPQILTISPAGLSEVRLNIPVDSDGIEELGRWSLGVVGLLDQLREKKNQEIDDAIRKSKRARIDIEELRDWEADVSRIKIYSLYGKCKFKLRAYGTAQAPQLLTVSLRCDSERETEVVSIERDDIERLAKWLIHCLVPLDWLRKKKEAEIIDALRKRRQIMRSSYFAMGL